MWASIATHPLARIAKAGMAALVKYGAGDTVADLAALKALSVATMADGVKMRTVCRAALGDGGGGDWYWDSGDMSAEVTADTLSGIYAAPDSDPTGASGAWRRITDGSANVRHFGAVGDGVTDDTAAIQAAVDHVRDRYYRTEGDALGTTQNQASATKIVFPPGGYVVTAPIDMTSIRTSHSWWYVDARGAVIFGRCTGKTIFDLLDSRKCSWIGGIIIGEEATLCRFGIQVGRAGGIAAYRPSDSHHFQDIEIKGYFDGACVYNYASEDTLWEHVSTKNDYDKAAAYCHIQDGQNYWGVLSDYVEAPATNTPASFLRNTFLRYDARKTNDGGALWIDEQAENHEMISSYLVAWQRHIIKIFFNAGTISKGLRLDLHIETDEVDTDPATGFDYGIVVDSATAGRSVRFDDFYYRDNTCHAALAFIKEATNIAAIKFVDAYINAGAIGRDSGQVLFSDPSKVSYVGKLVTLSGISTSFDLTALAAFDGEYVCADASVQGQMDTGTYTLRDGGGTFWKNGLRGMARSDGRFEISVHDTAKTPIAEVAFNGASAWTFSIAGTVIYAASDTSIYPLDDNDKLLGAPAQRWKRAHVSEAVQLTPQASAPTGVTAGALAISDGTGGGFNGVSGAGLYRHDGVGWSYVG